MKIVSHAKNDIEIDFCLFEIDDSSNNVNFIDKINVEIRRKWISCRLLF